MLAVVARTCAGPARDSWYRRTGQARLVENTCQAAEAGGRRACQCDRLGQAVQRRQQVQHALAGLQRLRQQRTQLRLVFGLSTTRSPTGSSIVCSLKRSMPRPRVQRQELAVDPQVRVAAGLGPLGEVGVDALAVHHQRRQQADMLAAMVAQQLRGDALGTLRLAPARRRGRSAARRASRTAGAGSARSRWSWRPCSCGHRATGAARSPPSAGCRRPRRPPAARPAARCCGHRH